MEKSRIKILHITSHFGGGVGLVLLNYLRNVSGDSQFIHEVVSLEYANQNAVEVSHAVGFAMADRMALNPEKIKDKIAAADLVLVHWWNHPLLYNLLVRTALPLCRLILWSHVSGFYPPYVFTEKILNYPDLFVFTTPVSLKAKEVRNLSDRQKEKLRVVWSTGGVDHVKSVRPKKHAGFTVGYIGTVDYAKIHPDFLNICESINIPDIKFVVCGGSGEENMKTEAARMGIDGKFNFTGQVSDVAGYLSEFDVFGYPLAPHHYGVCDQVLQESMAAGVAPVVLSNRMEKYIVKDGLTGVVAKNKKDYAAAIIKLYKNGAMRKSLSDKAREYALNNFSLEKMAGEWRVVFREALSLPKTAKRWPVSGKNRKMTASDVFLEALGNYGGDFVSYRNAKSGAARAAAGERISALARSEIWKSDTRGTVHHYNNFFPGDKYLREWSRLMK